MHPADALDFVFGGAVTRHEWDEAEPEERLRLVEAHISLGAVGDSTDDSDVAQLLQLAVVEQILADHPPEVWATAQRLADAGMSRDDVLGQLTVVLVHALRASLVEVPPPDDVEPVAKADAEPESEVDDAGPTPASPSSPSALSAPPRGDMRADDRYIAWLATLPLPTSATIADAVRDVAAEAPVLGRQELIDRALARLDYPVDNQPVRRQVERIEEHLAALTDEGPLAWLQVDRTVHVAALTDGITLTHWLTDDERVLGELPVDFDLAGFARVDQPVVDGRPLEVRRSQGTGEISWIGPAGWLDRFEPGTILAVRLGDDPDAPPGPGPGPEPDGEDASGAVTDARADRDAADDAPPDRRRVVHVEALADVPAVDEALVTALRRVYDHEVDEPGMPVFAEHLILGLVAEDGDVFATPQAPLGTLCEAAGLERRGPGVAHDVAVWANARSVAYMHVVHDRTDDKPTARAAVEALTVAAHLAEGLPVDLARRRAALNHLREQKVLGIVSDELFELGSSPTEADGFATEMLAAAHGSPQVSTARHLAALAAELAGEVDVAEQQLELAVEADSHNLAAVDRLGWYASDRGDAARAAGLWRRCEASDGVVTETRLVELFAAMSAPTVGRNDPCWCGSGRKHKHCHLGAAPTPPLPDRVIWMCQKAADFLRRHQAGREEVVTMAITLAHDTGGIGAALADPLTVDLVLVEGGWFHRFLEARGSLLPVDEAALMASWLAVPRSVYELTAVRPEDGFTVRDVRTGDEQEVRERTLSTRVTVGERLCARVVPDGDTHQIVGGAFAVRPDDVDHVLALLDDGDPYSIAAWYAAEVPVTA